MEATLKYKVAYTKGTNDMLYSKFFNTINEATSFGHSLKDEWLVFEKKASTNIDYSWKLLPYGNYKAYQNGLSLYKTKTFVVIVLFILVAFFFRKLF